MRKEVRLVLFILTALMMLIQVCPRADELSQAGNPYGGSLIWGVCHKPTIINPILTTHSVSATLMELIFNRLVKINMGLAPLLKAAMTAGMSCRQGRLTPIPATLMTGKCF